MNSGFRLIYPWFEVEQRIVLIELYHKNDKEIDDRERDFEIFRMITMNFSALVLLKDSEEIKIKSVVCEVRI